MKTSRGNNQDIDMVSFKLETKVNALRGEKQYRKEKDKSSYRQNENICFTNMPQIIQVAKILTGQCAEEFRKDQKDKLIFIQCKFPLRDMFQ